MKRPIGVVALAVVQLVGAAIFLVAAADLLLGNQSQQALQSAGLPMSRDMQVTLGVFALALGMVQLLIAWGLFNLKGWAWGFAALAAAANFVLGAVNAANGAQLGGEQRTSMVVSLVILLYLLLPGVRAAFFGRKPALRG
jgi:uncharacterized membrane protein (DUF2068 family)